MKQHVVTAWLLRAFAADSGLGPRLATYSKKRGVYGSEDPEDFMARIDSHAPGVEERLSRVESHAARASQDLLRRVLELPPGLARHTDRDEPPVIPTRDAGVAGGFRLTVAERGVAALNRRQRQALMKFLTLMFARSPRVERIIRDIGTAYSEASTQALLRAGFRHGRGMRETQAAVEAASHPTERALSMVKRIGAFPNELYLWVLRAGPDERFVLGDSPTAVAIGLGHVDAFRPLFGSSSFVIVLALHPEVALIATQAPVLPVVVEPTELVDAVNRLVWAWADDHVVAADPADLERVRRAAAPSLAAWTVAAPVDWDALRSAATLDVVHALVDAKMAHPVRLTCPATREVFDGLRADSQGIDAPGRPSVSRPARGPAFAPWRGAGRERHRDDADSSMSCPQRRR